MAVERKGDLANAVLLILTHRHRVKARSLDDLGDLGQALGVLERLGVDQPLKQRHPQGVAREPP